LKDEGGRMKDESVVYNDGFQLRRAISIQAEWLKVTSDTYYRAVSCKALLGWSETIQ